MYLHKSKLINIVINILVLTILFSVVYFSTLQGLYRVDPHHWGLMLSSAKDFVDGKIPYKDIYNIYGLLTTIIHSIAYKFLGENFSALMKVTALFYAVGLWVIFKISFRITNDHILALYVLITCVLIHPVAIYPWSNYIAFPFLMGGIFYLLSNENNKLFFLLSGFLMSLAALSREGLTLIVGLIIFLFLLVELIYKKENLKIEIRKFTYVGIGFVSPIFLFAIYLYYKNIVKYWILLSVDLPKAYALGQFPHMSSRSFLKPLLLEFKNNLVTLDIRWTIICLMSATLLIGLCLTIFKFKNIDDQKIKIIKISLASIALFATALHIPEIFRIATGSIIGIIVLFYWAKSLRLDGYLFIILTIPLILTLFKTNSGNPFYPEKKQFEDTVYITKPSAIRSQLWPIGMQNYYVDFQEKFKKKLEELQGI